LTGTVWLLVVGAVLAILVPYFGLRGRHGYQRILAWVFGTILALLVLWVVMIVIAAATGQLE
jgi:purine-cytosine permease-like protein